jgi:hypothetical protein
VAARRNASVLICRCACAFADERALETLANVAAAEAHPRQTEVVREKVAVHAVVRLDRYLLDVATDLTDVVTVVEVLPTRAEADSEVARLNGLGAGDERSVYFARTTRYHPAGRAAGI